MMLGSLVVSTGNSGAPPEGPSNGGIIWLNPPALVDFSRVLLLFLLGFLFLLWGALLLLFVVRDVRWVLDGRLGLVGRRGVELLVLSSLLLSLLLFKALVVLRVVTSEWLRFLVRLVLLDEDDDVVMTAKAAAVDVRDDNSDVGDDGS